MVDRSGAVTVMLASSPVLGLNRGTCRMQRSGWSVPGGQGGVGPPDTAADGTLPHVSIDFNSLVDSSVRSHLWSPTETSGARVGSPLAGGRPPDAARRPRSGIRAGAATA